MMAMFRLVLREYLLVDVAHLDENDEGIQLIIHKSPQTAWNLSLSDNPLRWCLLLLIR